jgi:plastocyanin
VIVTGCGGSGGGGGGTPPPPAVASVTITPNTAQSTTICGDVPFTAQARDAQNNTLTRTISWTATPANVSLSSTTGTAVTATGIAVGSSAVRATADGVPSSDVTVTVSAGGQPAASAGVDATAGNAFTPRCVVIAAGGTVTWSFAITHNVSFTGPQPPQGNIPDQTTGSASRTFPNAGSYPYTCTLHAGMNGRVIVQ